ncbi:upstream stimulatory factor 2 isoform X2 [Electrophorus electricus]|uniref:upstream stimulatory factor 2 isoform X2 n=1 Tax=Electrophorus electricus TaxID=8005 RepID=UPI0015CFA238|nr:upstream stimulatory factor 2 isoform X2 [Electrophorus electricus]
MDVLEQTRETSSRHEKQEEDIEQISEGVSSTGGKVATVAIAGIPHTSSFVDHNIQYQVCTDNSSAQVTYQVVLATDQPLMGGEAGNGGEDIVSTASFNGTPQAVIQSPYSNGGIRCPEPVASFPASTVTNVAATGVSVQPSNPSLPHTGGQFYVMMASPDVLQVGTPCPLAPHTHPYPLKLDGPRTPRDKRRRAQHNEVERRRRDKINNWIVTLSTIIPDCSLDSTKTGASKGGILSKACNYIEELRQINHTLQESHKEMNRIELDNEILRQQFSFLLVFHVDGIRNSHTVAG